MILSNLLRAISLLRQYSGWSEWSLLYKEIAILNDRFSLFFLLLTQQISTHFYKLLFIHEQCIYQAHWCICIYGAFGYCFCRKIGNFHSTSCKITPSVIFGLDRRDLCCIAKIAILNDRFSLVFFLLLTQQISSLPVSTNYYSYMSNAYTRLNNVYVYGAFSYYFCREIRNFRAFCAIWIQEIMMNWSPTCGAILARPIWRNSPYTKVTTST